MLSGVPFRFRFTMSVILADARLALINHSASQTRWACPSIHQRPTGENAQLGRHQKQRALQDASKMNLRLEHRCAQRRTGRAKSNAAEGINENTNMLEPARAPYCTSICSAKQRADLRQTDTARTKEFVVS
ncbi:Hypothetical_protein [Hexamita inflata]|uniref:Hypothetical_protein n=1 Tax=Hexamita inflata TaxID=28002 RepID=A0AA86UQL2_9EUKA|nr:Hypothetical protein HINF_LOCUS48497 [Hexamita inflata]